MAGTILQCRLIVTAWSLLSTSVECHLVSCLGTVGLMKQHVFSTSWISIVKLDWYTISVTHIQRKKKTFEWCWCFLMIVTKWQRNHCFLSQCRTTSENILLKNSLLMSPPILWGPDSAAVQFELQQFASKTLANAEVFKNVSCVLCLKWDRNENLWNLITLNLSWPSWNLTFDLQIVSVHINGYKVYIYLENLQHTNLLFIGRFRDVKIVSNVHTQVYTLW